MRIEPGYLPTPREISNACLQIRDGWSAAEQQRRLVGTPRELTHTHWQPPRIDTSMCTQRVRKEVSELTA